MNTYQLLLSPDEMNQKIARKMRERRKEKHLTQAALSNRANVSLGSLKNLYNLHKKRDVAPSLFCVGLCD